MSRPTISEVANAARVSKATVSRVLNGTSDYLRPATRARVLQAIEALNYRPSAVARSLSLRRTQTVGVLLADVSHPFSSEIIRGVEDVALADGYDIFLCNMMHEPARYTRLVQSLIDKQIDGVLVLTTTLPDSCLTELLAARTPVVALSRSASTGEPLLGSILVDFVPGFEAAVRHLLDLGHQRLAYVSSPLFRNTTARNPQVEEAFRTALTRNGLDPDQIPVLEGNQRPDSGKRALTTLLQRPTPPTAILAGDAYTAFGVLWAAQAFGLTLPGELSVISLDDLPLAEEVNPPLTTVAYPRYELGATAMNMLLTMLDPPDPLPADQVRQERLVTHLVVRASTAPVAR